MDILMAQKSSCQESAELSPAQLLPPVPHSGFGLGDADLGVTSFVHVNVEPPLSVSHTCDLLFCQCKGLDSLVLYTW